MSSIYLRDLNRVPTPIRQGLAIGGKVSLAGSGLTANTWYRLMPNGDDGELVDGDDRRLTIGTLRSDIIAIEGWNLIILNAGYVQHHVIVDHIGTDVTLRDPIQFREGMQNAELEDAVHFVMFPTLLSSLGINYKTGPDDDIEIGISTSDAYTPTTVKPLDDISAGELLMLNFSRIDRIFYRFPVVDTSETYVLGWGEHYRG